jgi:hypothetical protein
MSNNVVAYIVCQKDSDSSSSKVLNLSNLLAGAVSKTHIVDIEIPSDISYPKSLTKEEMKEIYRFMWCLNNSSRSYPDHHTLIVKSDSTMMTNTDNLSDVLTKITEQEYDISYLSSWNENCDAIDFGGKIEAGDNLIFKSVSPHGCQALMTSPDCRETLLDIIKDEKDVKTHDYNDDLSTFLNDLIVTKKINAIGVTPNVFIPDVTTENGKKLMEQMNQCISSPKNMMKEMTWMIVLIIAIIILVGFFYFNRK